LDTRGLDEGDYDAREDLERFQGQAHVILVTVKLLDQALENLVRHLRTLRGDEPSRPVVLALTCLHEAYPQKQHPEVYPFTGDSAIEETAPVSESLRGALAEKQACFQGLYDHLVPIDLTPPAEGFRDPHYGGQRLKETLFEALPAAYRQTVVHLDEATGELQDLFARHALPYILGYSTLAATAGALPIPWLDLLLLPGIQTRMIYHLAQLYGQPLNGQRFLELASSLGTGILVRQAAREVMKFIPGLGSVAGAGFAGAATFALGKAFCFYFSAVHKGHVPKTEDLRKYYQEQLSHAEAKWRQSKESTSTSLALLQRQAPRSSTHPNA
jgi:uncharacterized protein (DUF697 family)